MTFLPVPVGEVEVRHLLLDEELLRAIRCDAVGRGVHLAAPDQRARVREVQLLARLVVVEGCRIFIRHVRFGVRGEEMEAASRAWWQREIQVHRQLPLLPQHLLDALALAPGLQLIGKDCAVIIIVRKFSGALEFVYSILEAVVAVHDDFPRVVEAVVAAEHHARHTVEI